MSLYSLYSSKHFSTTAAKNQHLMYVSIQLIPSILRLNTIIHKIQNLHPIDTLLQGSQRNTTVARDSEATPRKDVAITLMLNVVWKLIYGKPRQSTVASGRRAKLEPCVSRGRTRGEFIQIWWIMVEQYSRWTRGYPLIDVDAREGYSYTTTLHMYVHRNIYEAGG